MIIGSLGIGLVKNRWPRTSAENADKTVLFLSFLGFVHDYASTNVGDNGCLSGRVFHHLLRSKLCRTANKPFPEDELL